MRICFSESLARAGQEGSPSGCYRRTDPITRLFLGTGEVLSSDHRSQEPRRFDESEYIASSGFLSAGAPDWRIIHWLLPRNGCHGHISSSDVFFRLSGSSRIGSEAGGLRVSNGRAKERLMLNRR